MMIYANENDPRMACWLSQTPLHFDVIDATAAHAAVEEGAVS